MKSKNGKCPFCSSPESKLEGITGFRIYSECKSCNQVFWEDATELSNEEHYEESTNDIGRVSKETSNR